MAKQIIGIPKGTRDFSPETVKKREYIFETIKLVFKKFGFEPIETPAMENLSTLLGKYGEEGDKLLFKVLNSGDFLKSTTDSELQERNLSKLAGLISNKGLRYDLTVPFARYVVQHQNEIAFPFRRYQIQPVWRADRPQKGRYREFFQCDADVIGSKALLNELEIIQMIDEVFLKLDIDVTIKINNRKILAGIAEHIGYPEKLTDITVAIDKLDKIGLEKVYQELSNKGISDNAIKSLEPIINLSGNTNDILNCLNDFLADSEIGQKGIQEIEELFEYTSIFNFKNNIELDLTLARGLNYYTGAIFEVTVNDYSIGSVCGGGRYDNLTGVFGLKDVSGVGISFGADRIFDVLEAQSKFPEYTQTGSNILFINFGKDEEKYCLNLLAVLRKNGINAEIYPQKAKMKKQMTYANKKGVKFVALAGENEIKENKITIKNMQTGNQELIKTGDLLNIFKR